MRPDRAAITPAGLRALYRQPGELTGALAERSKPGGNRLYFIPDANHYLQADRPDAFVKVLLHALGPADGQGRGALEPEPGAPLLVDTSRERLPAAADLLRTEGPVGAN